MWILIWRVTLCEICLRHEWQLYLMSGGSCACAVRSKETSGLGNLTRCHILGQLGLWLLGCILVPQNFCLVVSHLSLKPFFPLESPAILLPLDGQPAEKSVGPLNNYDAICGHANYWDHAACLLPIAILELLDYGQQNSCVVL